MKVLVTGGGGYLGSVLVPALLERGHSVTALDWFLYGDTLDWHERLTRWHGDVRTASWKKRQFDAVIHLACVSNDPSFDLDADFGRDVNYSATLRLIYQARDAGVQRFIYASSSSVYGVKPEGVKVTEDLALEPITPYASYKAWCEEPVRQANSPRFTTTVLRPATLCGYAPRLRLDLIVNILTSQAYHNGTITVHGGTQRRPNLHVQDMVRAYIDVLEAPADKVAGQVFNVGTENATVNQLAEYVHDVVGGEIVVLPDTNDPRSYTIDSSKIAHALGFKPRFTIHEAIMDLTAAFKAGKVRDVNESRYYNIKQMQTCHIS